MNKIKLVLSYQFTVEDPVFIYEVSMYQLIASVFFKYLHMQWIFPLVE